jgi:fumarate hydratase, class I
MKPIAQNDFIQSIADSFQFISYYHPTDFVQALGRAYEKEQNPAAKDALGQILTNSRMSAEGHRLSAKTRALRPFSLRWVCICAGKVPP